MNKPDPPGSDVISPSCCFPFLRHLTDLINKPVFSPKHTRGCLIHTVISVDILQIHFSSTKFYRMGKPTNSNSFLTLYIKLRVISSLHASTHYNSIFYFSLRGLTPDPGCFMEHYRRDVRSSGTLEALNLKPKQTCQNRDCCKLNLTLFTNYPKSFNTVSFHDVYFSVLPWPLGRHQIGTTGGGFLLSAWERSCCSSAAVPYQWGEPNQYLWSTMRVTFHMVSIWVTWAKHIHVHIPIHVLCIYVVYLVITSV